MPPWRRQGRVSGTQKLCRSRLQSPSNTYRVYFGNPELLPTVRVAPANNPPSDVWTLAEGENNVTVEDIEDFIVKFMNSDRLVWAALSYEVFELIILYHPRDY
jgi:hypothetical protein